MLRRLFIMKMLIVLHVAFVSFGLSTGSTFVGSKAVNWTFYTGLKLSWDEAAQFCFEKSSHLPVTNSSITMAAFSEAADSLSVSEVWLGLHSRVQGKAANVWEADCSLVPTSIEYWASKEPNNLYSDLCIRMDSGKWKTINCANRYTVACEKEKGDCTYSTLSDVTMIAAPNASTGNVNTLAACWSLCLEAYLQGQECVVAALLKTTAVCTLYLGERLLGKSDVKTSPMEESTVMVRQCFQTLEDETALKPEIDTSTLSRCPSIYTASAKTEDNLPPGVVLGPTVVTTQPPTTDSGDSMTTTASSSPDPSTTEPPSKEPVDKVTTTASSSPDPSTTEPPSKEPVDKVTTTASSSPHPSTTEPTSEEPVDKVTTTASSSPDPSTTEPPSKEPVDKVTTTASSSPDPSTTATTTTSSRQPATTVETTMAPSSESPTSEAKTSTAASTKKTVGCRAQETGAGRCRCVFENDKNNDHQPTTTPSPLRAADDVIVPTNTSKFRRSKTSAVTTGASYTVIGTTWIFVLASIFCLIILSDLTRFCQWVARNKAKIKARKGKVQSAP